MMKKLSFYLFLAFTVITGFSCSKSAPEWTTLFNGTDLSGWEELNGEAPYKVIDSVIVGTTVLNSPNSFLCTKENYGDFILEFDFKVNPQMNSGVQIRSKSTADYQNGRVHGYQVEIDPSDRAWTGGIYDEGRTGWLYTLAGDECASARKAFLQNEWNKVRVEAIGNSIKTWINNIPVANLLDETDASGFIALQVHSIGNDSAKVGEQIMWKNIRIITKDAAKFATATTAPEKSYLLNTITETEKAAGWKLLFDGQTTNGWRKAYGDKFPEKGWQVKDGVLTVLAAEGAESQNGGDIVTMDQYSNFELTLQVKFTPAANSGIKYFVTEQEVNNPGSAIGLEYQVLDDNLHPDAKLGNHDGSRTFASLYDLIKATNKRPNAVGEWNNVRIISKDNHIEHWLNGFKVLEYERGSEEFRKLVSESKYKIYPNFGEAQQGHLLLQDHGNEVSYRSVKVRGL